LAAQSTPTNQHPLNKPLEGVHLFVGTLPPFCHAKQKLYFFLIRQSSFLHHFKLKMRPKRRNNNKKKPELEAK
jgi:hypothetical protein